jgi:hypothetical protein
MDIVYKYRGWFLGISLILNIFICLIYRYTSEPSVVGMGLILYLLPLLCIQILITVVGYIFIKNQIISYVSFISGFLVLVISVYCALNIK